MNIPTFKSNYVTCPICNRSSSLPSTEMLNGLFTCPHCRSHLVISWSGHYVRDPFTIKQVSTGQMLRRQSRPLARLRRDLCRQYLPLLAIAGSVVLMGFAIATLDSSNQKPNLLNGIWEWVTGEQKPENTSP